MDLQKLGSIKKTHELYELEAKNRYLEYLLVNKNSKQLPKLNVNRQADLIKQEYKTRIAENVNKLRDLSIGMLNILY